MIVSKWFLLSNQTIHELYQDVYEVSLLYRITSLNWGVRRIEVERKTGIGTTASSLQDKKKLGECSTILDTKGLKLAKRMFALEKRMEDYENKFQKSSAISRINYKSIDI